jgi:hypothetical protein
MRPPRSANGHHYDREIEDEVELNLLSEQERRQAALDVNSSEVEQFRDKSKSPLSKKDKQAMALLIILCTFVSSDLCDAQADLERL